MDRIAARDRGLARDTDSLERRLIQRALNGTSGAQAEAARRLGVSRSDLGYKLSKHEIKAAGE